MFFLLVFWIPFLSIVTLLVGTTASLTRNRGMRAPLLVAVGAYPAALLGWLLVLSSDPFASYPWAIEKLLQFAPPMAVLFWLCRWVWKVRSWPTR